MAETRPSIAVKRRTFLQLHEAGCFLIPNPWDVGTARYLQSLGFKALATTSSGFGWSKGRPDAAKPRDMAPLIPPSEWSRVVKPYQDRLAKIDAIESRFSKDR